MCDTLVVLPEITANGNLIFAKNSDREPDEAQTVTLIPGQQHDDAELKCTYISIPQVKETYSCLLSKPFHIWGAEMGVNEFGLCVGNEAVFTKVKILKNNDGLSGMDLVRLALERTQTAEQAVQIIIELLETYGQDACGGYKNNNFFYHNSFLIADQQNAYVLETAGRSWAYQKVKHKQTISNRLTLSNDYDKASFKNEAYTFPYYLIPGKKTDDFSKRFSDMLYTKVSRAKIRQFCTFQSVKAKEKSFCAEDAMQILRTHFPEGEHFNPKTATPASICMHATGMLNPSQTTGSMVAEIRKEQPSTIWLTATSMPCLSVFLPFFMGTNTLAGFKQPSSKPDDSLWWKAEKLHRWVCADYQNRKLKFFPKLETLQQRILEEEKLLFSSKPALQQLESFSSHCLQQYTSLLDNLTEVLLSD